LRHIGTGRGESGRRELLEEVAGMVELLQALEQDHSMVYEAGARARSAFESTTTGQSARAGFWRFSDLQKLLTKYLGQMKRVQADRSNVQELLSRNHSDTCLQADTGRDSGINVYCGN